MDRPIEFVAELEHVREVSLIGLANKTFWQQKLANEGYVPVDVGGLAQLVISGTNARFRGVRFRELSIGIRVLPLNVVSPREGIFLPAAFHSSRFFGWIERYFFSAPYQYAKIDVESQPTALIELRNKFDPVLRVQLDRNAPRSPQRVRPEAWEGPVYLPQKPGEPSPEKRWFYARLSGETQTFAFSEAHDVAWFRNWEERPILQQLAESEFKPTDWMIRDDAQHAKSKTYSGFAALPAFHRKGAGES